ncbi:MAG: hypothetical protein H6822_26370 [Planctomycetaceae bacterium]|nr:hypothetical protein [Planctomycetales bacterium]MCB9925703.1 hypothetical protein [Planctomycetaceae bacterium]
MKPVMIGAALLVASLMFTGESHAQNCYGGGISSGLPYYGFGYSGSLYGLGYVPVPPYFALHPPVYYSHEIRRRPIGDSPYAYSARRPAPEPKRQFSMNPFVPSPVIEEGPLQTSQPTDAVAKIMRNPFYGDDAESLLASKLIYNPHYAKPEVFVANAAE